MIMWDNDTGLIDVTSAFRGVTIPKRELLADIEKRGWQVTKLQWKKDSFVAEAKNPHGEKREAKGPDEATALASLLMLVMRKDFMRAKVQQKVGMWKTDFVGQLEQIAQAYAKAPAYEPKAASAWMELAHDSMRRSEHLAIQLKIEVTGEPEPYESAEEMCEDIKRKKRLKVSSFNVDHPVWSYEQVIAFRTAHDVLGYCAGGGDFTWVGENKAFAAHAPLLSPTAQRALWSETLAPAAYALYFKAYGPKKVAFTDSKLKENTLELAQEKENALGHRPLHPSQHILPTEVASPAPAVPQTEDADTDSSSQLFGISKTAGSIVDPNAGWQSHIEPPPDNAFLAHGDPLQAHEVGGTLDTASRIDTNWHQLSEDEAKQAIVNAFRAALLSPRKNLKWNAIHYQDIAHIPATVDDPNRYWDALERRRETWNQARGYEPGSHKIWWKPLQEFYGYVRTLHPELHDGDVKNLADRTFREIWNEEEERFHLLDKDKPAEAQLAANDLERKVAKAVAKRLTMIVKPNLNAVTDHPHFDHPQLFTAAGEQLDVFTGEPADKYGAWMGCHLKGVAQISRYADVLLQSALEDIRHHDATGHHFRATALSLDIPGVGPKVISFAWLLLQPLTSQLATVDSHMMDALGHDYSEMNDRDYFKYERELAAGRDAAGYGHVPLGAFQWGLWDHKRTGPGSHQDHSGLRVLDPVPALNIDWANKAPTIQGESWAKLPPDWWFKTQPYRDVVAEDWDQNTAPNFAKHQIPYRLTTELARAASWKASNSNAVPYYIRDGQRFEGIPGQSIMNHLKTGYGYGTEDIWKLENEVGKA